MFVSGVGLFLICECKGSVFLLNHQTFPLFFFKKVRFSLFFSLFEYFRIVYMEILTTFATYNCALYTKAFQAY